MVCRLDSNQPARTDACQSQQSQQSQQTQLAPGQHRVESGEHLLGIMRKHGLPARDLKAVAAINNLADPNHITPGTILKIPTREEIDGWRDMLTRENTLLEFADRDRFQLGDRSEVDPRFGLTTPSLSVGVQLAQKRGPRSALEFIRDNFKKWDLNNDGFISDLELLGLEKNPAIKGEQACFVATLLTVRLDLQNLSNDEVGAEDNGISMADIEAAFAANTKAAKELRRLAGTKSNLVEYLKRKLENTSREVFATGLPNYQAASQGGAGDCYFLAPLVSLAKADPQAIVDMIKDNGDGTYTVKIAGTERTIQGPTDTELLMYSTARKDGLWLSIIEKAFAEHSNATKDPGFLRFRKWRSQDAINGDSTSVGTAALRNRPVETMMANTDAATLRTLLLDAQKRKAAVSASVHDPEPTFFESLFGKVPKNGLGLPANHAYSVLDYDPATDTISIRNPWGRGEPENGSGEPLDGSDDGIFKLSLEQFRRYFFGIYFEK